MSNELNALSAIVGAPVLAAERCKWGFENHTALVTLADGRRLIVQRISNRALAPHKLQLAQALPVRLAAVDIRAPAQLDADAAASPPYAVREFLPGELAATRMGRVEGAVAVARAMGALLPRLALVETGGIGLESGWATPSGLADLAQQQLARCRELLDGATTGALQATIAELPALFGGRAAVFAHGDFCPVNALIEPTPADTAEHPNLALVGLLDFEFSRVADPLFDAAWWGWVVRYHHFERWVAAWPQLLAAAGIAPDDATQARVRVLQRLRCLEMIDDHARARQPEAAAMWVERLAATLAWEG